MNYDDFNESHRESTPRTTINNEFLVVGGVLLRYSGCDSIVKIPDGIIAIGDNAFLGNISLKEVYFSKSVSKIGKNAFKDCIALKRIYNYSNIKIFEDFCFQSTNLVEISIGPQIESLGNGCFSKIETLEVVYYEAETDLKLHNTFYRCSKLANVEDRNHCFFPSLHASHELYRNPYNTKPSWGDAFRHTPYIKIIYKKYRMSIKNGICPTCGSKLRKILFFIVKNVRNAKSIIVT